MTSRLALGRGREGRRVFRGWLLFFFATTCVGVATGAVEISHALDAAATASASGSTPPVGSTVVALIVRIVLWGATLYGLYLFARGDVRTPTWWGAVLVASASFSVALIVAHAYRSMVVDQTPFFTALLWAVQLYGSSSFVVRLAWLAYWMRSARVRRTFGANAFAHVERASTTHPAGAASPP